ncbi:MAG: gamma-glutamyltransferase, partial [Gammaproteobacteria bacterium]|nr:gamma-glutamyltransferase [Gammaproteobacteria bacterium]
FGSAVTVPGTGVVLNNGMMWFDPRPGLPNSAGPGKRPLNNMSPMIVLRDGRPVMAVGAMGGRRIISAVVAIVSNVLDFGMGMQEACEAPRLDLSTGGVLVDPRIPAGVIAELHRRGHDVQVRPDTFGAFEFGSPACILIEDGGLMRTGVDALNPAASAAM